MLGKTLLATVACAASLLAADLVAPFQTGSLANAQAGPGKRKPPPNAAPRPAPRVVAPRPAPRIVAPRPVTPRVAPVARPRPVPVRVNPVVVNTNRGAPALRPNRRFPQATPPHLVNPNFGRGRPGVRPVIAQPVLRTGPGGITRLPPRGPVNRPGLAPVVHLHNKAFPVHKGPKRIWSGGGWKAFVPFAALGAVMVGRSYYYPDAYVSVARPYCGGVTPEGCRLSWRMVEFEGGGGDYQCVQYCPRPNQPPPAVAN